MKIKIGNGFFGMMAALAATTVLNTASAQRPEKRVSFHDNKVSVVLQDGWVKSERKGDQLIAGFVSSDERSSVFFTLAAAGNRAEMKDIMDGAVKNFENAFDVKKVSKYATGQIQGPNKKWPAIYATMELEMKTNRDPIPFRFYVVVFETKSQIYMIQGSTMSPIREVREKEIIKMMKSVIAQP